MFIYMRGMLINFSLATAIRKGKEVRNLDEFNHQIVVEGDGGGVCRLNYEVESERDKAFADLMKWVGTINPNNMVP